MPVEEDEEHIPEGPVTVYRHRDSTLSGTVIFPITKAQSNGLEDLRITHFRHEDGRKNGSAPTPPITAR
jgi:hypothetical protein